MKSIVLALGLLLAAHDPAALETGRDSRHADGLASARVLPAPRPAMRRPVARTTPRRQAPPAAEHGGVAVLKRAVHDYMARWDCP